jgi:DNA mismatch repair protein MutL
MPVKVLPQTLINQIAAGEVVVRMASAVKELVENSIDAGATRIEVILGNEGRDAEVRDDGCGMSRDDAEMSLQRHATSKIRNLEDLMAVRTRGFRGEAVPSIASVSRMEIQTREHGALAGTRIVVEGGRIERIEAVGCPPGTRMIVRDLFFNTPARRKFLKAPAAETNAVLGTITRQAIAQHGIGWRVEREGDLLLDLPPGQSLAERFAAILGSHLQRPLIPFDLTRDDVRAFGLIAHPDDARGDRRHQYLFLNARPFASRPIAMAMEQACKGFTMVGKFPIVCAFVDVPAGDVDINVHPTKEEVRFRDERHVAGTLYRAVEEALGGAPALIGEIGPSQRVEPQRDAPPQSFGIAPPPFFTSPEALVRRAFDRKQERTFQQPDALVEASRAAAPAPQISPRLSASRHADGTAISAGSGEVPDAAFWSKALEAEPLGQVAETYIVVALRRAICCIDRPARRARAPASISSCCAASGARRRAGDADPDHHRTSRLRRPRRCASLPPAIRRASASPSRPSARARGRCALAPRGPPRVRPGPHAGGTDRRHGGIEAPARPRGHARPHPHPHRVPLGDPRRHAALAGDHARIARPDQGRAPQLHLPARPADHRAPRPGRAGEAVQAGCIAIYLYLRTMARNSKKAFTKSRPFTVEPFTSSHLRSGCS